MFDSARALERRPYYRAALQFLADRGVNTVLWHFTDDQGCAMQFNCVPGVASPNAYSKSEMRELVLQARELGIDLIPEVASLGHTGYLTRLPAFRALAESDEMFSSVCPLAAETRSVLRALIEETATVFDGPNFHVGLDETNFGRHPLSKAALAVRSRTEIFADHIHFVHDVVTKLGRRMWMWADGLLHDPALANRLPRDIVMCNWKYRPTEPVESTQYLLDQGFDVVLCSATISSQQMLFPGNRFALPNLRGLQKHLSLVPSTATGSRVLGQITTVWTPVRYLADSLWLGLDLALTIMADGASTDAARTMARFGQQFFGLDQPSTFVEASQIVLDQSPLRDDWLAMLTLDFDHQESDERRELISAGAPAWRRASKALADGVRPQVTRHTQEFSTYCLMVELVAHVTEVAAAFPTLTARAARIFAAARTKLLREIESLWDYERYPDDPRKYAAPVRHFDGDHLIPNLRSGITRLESIAAALT